MVIFLSLRKQGCKSMSYVIYTLYYTQKIPQRNQIILLVTYILYMLISNPVSVVAYIQ